MVAWSRLNRARAIADPPKDSHFVENIYERHSRGEEG